MFYGNFKGPDDRQYLREAIARFRTIFGQVFAGDNVILFQRTLGFRRNKTTFRIQTRIDGSPVLSAPETPPNSADTVSPFIVLAA